MTAFRLLTGAFWVGALGLVAALPLGENRRISIEIWLAAVAVWLTWLAISRLLSISPVVPDRMRRLWAKPSPADPPDHRPRNLMALEGLLLQGRDHERAHALRLRPRLRSMVAHLLRVDHGIDLHTQPEDAAAVLGDHWWIVDDQAPWRRPTLAQIDQLLDRLEDPSPITAARRGRDEPDDRPSTEGISR